jgi:NUMOD4 motif
MSDERWLPVVGWEGYYEVSDHGRVRRVPRTVLRKDGVRRDYPQRLMSQSTQSLGYNVVHLKVGGRSATKHVYVVVLTAFIGDRPKGMVGCHNDGNPGDIVKTCG